MKDVRTPTSARLKTSSWRFILNTIALFSAKHDNIICIICYHHVLQTGCYQRQCISVNVFIHSDTLNWQQEYIYSRRHLTLLLITSLSARLRAYRQHQTVNGCAKVIPFNFMLPWAFNLSRHRAKDDVTFVCFLRHWSTFHHNGYCFTTLFDLNCSAWI